jgi:plasmid maintenance system killer protein
MQFLIADSFTASLAKLTSDEQKATKTKAFDLQTDLSAKGLRFHRIEKSKDQDFWSVSVNKDLRIIVHKNAGRVLICYVDHHDEAYSWAERRKLETHPKTGAAQFVEVRERIKEITVPHYVKAKGEAPSTKNESTLTSLQGLTDEDLLGYGLPEEWLEDIRKADEDSLLEIADHLPGEAAEALLQLAIGEKPVVASPPKGEADPFEHPDAQRRFRIMGNREELERALEHPWEKWTVFLHPEQRKLVERIYRGPVRIAGSAGTGKTIVALHRSVFLARNNPAARVLLTTFSEILAESLKVRLKRLAGSETRLLERIEVQAIDKVGSRIAKAQRINCKLVNEKLLLRLIGDAVDSFPDCKFSCSFVYDEWCQVVDAWNLQSWEAYRDVLRLGRRTRISEAQRMVLWKVFECLREKLAERGFNTKAGLFSLVTEKLVAYGKAPFDFAIVDESQDITVPQLRFLSTLVGSRQDGLFFAGDLGQRIFQPPFSWKALGVDIRGRSHTLRINYRTSHQIRRHADRLLPPEISDADGNSESRRGATSVFNGPDPVLQIYKDEKSEAEGVSKWILELIEDGFLPEEIGVFVRSEEQLVRAQSVADLADLPSVKLMDSIGLQRGGICLCNMHLAKGLEFRAVAVLACDDEIIPLQSRIEAISDGADLEEVYNTERHLLYVACTRARDKLLVSAASPESEFLVDLGLDH